MPLIFYLLVLELPLGLGAELPPLLTEPPLGLGADPPLWTAPLVLCVGAVFVVLVDWERCVLVVLLVLTGRSVRWVLVERVTVVLSVLCVVLCEGCVVLSVLWTGRVALTLGFVSLDTTGLSVRVRVFLLILRAFITFVLRLENEFSGCAVAYSLRETLLCTAWYPL